MASSEVTIRYATQNDIPLILSFLHKKAEFDKSMGAFEGTLQATEEKIAQSLFGSVPFAKVLFGEVLGQKISFALYYFRYSSFAARPSLWLDDLYVDLEARSKGVGFVLMKAIVQIAENANCTHLAWTASANNHRGISFYQRMGAKIIDRKDNTLFFKMGAN
jgi:GNAT superfamily N-acetyltransferase